MSEKVVTTRTEIDRIAADGFFKGLIAGIVIGGSVALLGVVLVVAL